MNFYIKLIIMYCAPGKGDEVSCYNHAQLKHIASEYNKKIADRSGRQRINIRSSKNSLWNQLKEGLADACNDEICWAEQDFIRNNIDEDAIFRPKQPPGKYQWLSTSNINKVMKQYEHLYPDFIFMGPVPMDFLETVPEVGNLDIATLYRSGKRKIGIIFNTDPSTKPGKHWIALFIDLVKFTVNFFDSFAKCPAPAPIQQLINRIKTHETWLHCRFIVNCNRIQHQFSSSECGVYSMWFITQSLEGKTFAQITNNIVRDEEMNRYRTVFFRP